MLIKQITGKTEELAITVTKSCQVIAITTNATDFLNEQVEVTLVDFNSGIETPLLRKNSILMYAEIAAQGGNVRKMGTAIIEVADAANLYLDANRVLRINLTGLVGASVYELMTIETEETGGKPISYEQLIIANGVTNQKFPVNNGNLLILPKTDLQDVRLLFSDGTEVRQTKKEMEIYHQAVNGIIALETDGNTMKHGSDKIFCIDLILPNKKVVEVELNLSASNGYTMYKCVNLDKPGFDHRF